MGCGPAATAKPLQLYGMKYVVGIEHGCFGGWGISDAEDHLVWLLSRGFTKDLDRTLNRIPSRKMLWRVWNPDEATKGRR